MKGITLHKGELHVSAGDAAAMHCGIFGGGSYVLQMGEQFRYELASNNAVKVYSGEGMINGRHFRIPPNEYTEFTIENGNQGVKRRDLLVVRYEIKEDGTESIVPLVLKGTPALNPADPAYNRGDIYKGDTIVDYPLYRVTIDGISITAVEQLFIIIPSLANVWPVGSIYMSVNNQNPSQLFGGTWVRFAVGRVLVGVSESDADFNGPEKYSGEKVHTLSAAELPSHAHGLNGHTHPHGAHSHTVGNENAGHKHGVEGSTITRGEHTHLVPYDTAGNHFAKGSENYRRVTNAAGIDGTVKTIADGSGHTHEIQGETGYQVGNHNHAVTGGANGNTGGATGNTASTGSGSAHNNMPPYMTCYMWKRTA